MITYLIIGITVILSFICFSNRELFMKLKSLATAVALASGLFLFQSPANAAITMKVGLGVPESHTWIYPCGYDTFASECVHVLVIWSLY